MLIVIVHIRVLPDKVEAFREATLANVNESVKEPGIARFDFIREVDDPCRFVLIEVYRDKDAPARHKETAHYLKWRDTVAEMMAEPRTGMKYTNVFPGESGWDYGSIRNGI